jgi:hypothetical protein
MKKLSIIIIAALILSSCHKDQKCWKCELGATNGNPPSTKIVCGKYPDKFLDNQGNEIAFTCH